MPVRDTKTPMARGERNNNPGNIEAGAPWQGLADPIDMTPEQRAEKRFAVFVSAKWGIRAIARTLITYQDKRKAKDGSAIDTVREIIERWAPPTENDTNSYVRAVRRKMGLNQEEFPGEVDVHLYQDMFPIVEAIIKHELGYQPYSKAEIDAGLILAGVEPPKRDLSKSRTIAGAQVATGATALGVAVEIIEKAEPVIPLVQHMIEVAPWLLAVVAVGGIGWIVWARYDDHRRGLR